MLASSAPLPFLPPAPAAAPAPDALQALRQATGSLHSELDRSLPLAGPAPTLADHAHHLLAVHAWLDALAPWLDRLEPLLAQPPRIERLRADLRDCGEPLPRPQPLPGLGPADDGSLAFCWGLAYVVEGSALGGQVLQRRLAPLWAPHPLRYLAGEGQGTAQRWRAVTAALRAHLGTPSLQAAACAGAVAGFRQFRAALAAARTDSP